ncbi:MAG: anti-sigma-factor antagonist [Ilumatobacteraceae bacterium]|nr:anti-sigma-factor antagonist [Ilumatobacteraceae bacterium]
MSEPAVFEAFNAQHEGSAIVTVRGEIDLPSMEMFAASVDEAIAASSHVVLDMSEVTFLDSTGLRVIVAAVLRVSEGGSLTVRDASPAVTRVLQLSGIDSVVTMDPR